MQARHQASLLVEEVDKDEKLIVIRILLVMMMIIIIIRSSFRLVSFLSKMLLGSTQLV